jgi:hypothetical protein
MQRRVVLGSVVALGILMVAPLHAQRAESFHARLSWVPISGAERNDVSGKGEATATLSGARLSVSGTFEGLPAAATAVNLHRGVATGVRGPAIAPLEINKSASGTISGEIELTPELQDALRAGHLYLQIHAERGVAPDNAVLFGWLLSK